MRCGKRGHAGASRAGAPGSQEFRKKNSGGGSMKIGIDIGGTFTDIVAVDDRGAITATKAFSTPGDFSRGVMDSLAALATKMQMTLPELASSITEFVNGSTVATNSLAEWRGAKVGLLTTEGFKDLLRIARSARINDFDLHHQQPLPEVVARTCIRTVPERIDRNGSIVFPLDENEAKRTIRELVEQEHVESIAVVFLWSFRNSEHERRVGELIRELYPTLHYSLSHQIHPVWREFERMVTTIFNSYVGVSVVRYLDGLERDLSGVGIKCSIDMMQCGGGRTRISAAKVRPVELLQSGPVAGAIGSMHLGKLLDRKNLILGDMGGTSFDTAVVVNGDIKKRSRVMVGGFLTGLTMVDVVSIGAGGGSIAWIDQRNMPRVGPQSAGARPGPACYNRGGTEPTVTDISLALGHLNPDYFLGGRVLIYPELASRAIEDKFAKPLKVGVEEAAIGARQLITASMSSAVRSVTIEQGYDPRNFSMVSYGGMGPLFVADICKDLGITEIVVPAASATFSAHGLLVSEHERNYVRTFRWTERDPEDVLAGVFESMERQAIEEFAAVGIQGKQLSFHWEADIRFEGQFFEFSIPVPRGTLNRSAIQSVRNAFVAMYEERYGSETAWKGQMEIVNCRLRAREIRPAAQSTRFPDAPSKPGECLKGSRRAFVSPDGMTDLPIYDGTRCGPGTALEGPAIIEEEMTTILVPPHFSVKRDSLMNYVLTSRGA